jgi:hypothetical protein
MPVPPAPGSGREGAEQVEGRLARGAKDCGALHGLHATGPVPRRTRAVQHEARQGTASQRRTRPRLSRGVPGSLLAGCGVQHRRRFWTPGIPQSGPTANHLAQPRKDSMPLQPVQYGYWMGIVTARGGDRLQLVAVWIQRTQNKCIGPLAQRLEQRTHNPLVVGSNPTGPTIPPF